MYIAVTKTNSLVNFFLRESFSLDGKLTYRNLVDLGTDPSVFINYAGGNAFYFDEIIEEKISALDTVYGSDEIEELFWPWIRSDIKRAIYSFRNRSFKKSSTS